MKISLNKHDLHAAVRGYLASRNIVSDNTEVEISIKAIKGGQPSAEISILDGSAAPIIETVHTPKIAKPAFLSGEHTDSA